MRSRVVIAWVSGLGGLLAAGAVFADGVFQNITGEVKAGVGSAAPVAPLAGERFQSGATVRTGPGSGAILKFDDGHGLVLHEKTELRISNFRFDRDRPGDDNLELQLVAGALRSVTGVIGQRSRNRVVLAIPQAKIGIRGTDFTVVLANPAYLSVAQGAIGVSNAAGSVVFSSGALGTVAADGSLAAPVMASAVPAPVSAAFRALGGAAVGGAADSGAGAAGGGFSGANLAPGGNVAGTLTAIAIGVLAVAVAGKRNALTAAQR